VVAPVVAISVSRFRKILLSVFSKPSRIKMSVLEMDSVLVHPQMVKEFACVVRVGALSFRFYSRLPLVVRFSNLSLLVLFPSCFPLTLSGIPVGFRREFSLIPFVPIRSTCFRPLAACCRAFARSQLSFYIIKFLRTAQPFFRLSLRRYL